MARGRGKTRANHQVRDQGRAKGRTGTMIEPRAGPRTETREETRAGTLSISDIHINKGRKRLQPWPTES